MINDYNEEDWTDAPAPHEETFKKPFGESLVDFKAFFKAGDFDKDRSDEHYEKLGRTLAEIYQADFEEDNGHFKNQCDHPVTRACDIKDSMLAPLFESLVQDFKSLTIRRS